MSGTAISAIVTAYDRIDQAIDTLRRLQACRPPPNEVLVHVDANRTDCADAIRAALPHIQIVVSDTPLGPGGGRNKLIAAASNEVIASFDDDSYPADPNYFERVQILAEMFPDAAIIAANIYHRSESPPEDEKVIASTSSFGSGGVIFRRTQFLATGGFVPLVVAYGMEEEDLALRLIDRGETLLRSPWLRVFHDTDLSHHAFARVTAGVIANLALITWLRYPARYWFYGVLQVANRVVWCLRAGRRAGIASGIASIPSHLLRHRNLRQPVSVAAMRQRFQARRAKPVHFQDLIAVSTDPFGEPSGKDA